MTLNEAVANLFANEGRNRRLRARRGAFKLGLAFAARRLERAAATSPEDVSAGLMKLASELRGFKYKADGVHHRE